MAVGLHSGRFSGAVGRFLMAILLGGLAVAPATAQTTVAPGAGGKALATGLARLTLEQILTSTRRDNLLLQAVRAQALASRASVVTARAYPNPEIDLQRSNFQARQPGAAGGPGTALSIAQRIEAPALRESRVGAATAGAQAAEIGVWVTENNLVADVKLKFFETLKREEELDVASEEQTLTEQIRDRIRVRSRTGESPRFDLIRADNEVAIAAKQVAIARARVAEAKAALRLAVGGGIPAEFTLVGDFYRSSPKADYASLRDAVIVSNPEIKRSQAELARSERQVDVERNQVLPSVTVRLAHETEPDIQATRAGIALSVPLWDRRRGPIDEAQALVIRSRSELELRRFALAQSFDAAWQQYLGALGAVQAMEGGILGQARTVVDIAEAAYRFGERGILEYLDARRQFRAIRGELIVARFELYAALTELERLAARDIKGD